MLITGISQLVTNDSGERGDLGLVRDAAVVVTDDTITWAGAGSDIPRKHRDAELFDVGGRAVVPGFVDAHTHLVFAGDRSDEFARRLRGESYEQILAGGGGIHSTVASTRAASTAELTAASMLRAQRMLRSGTTTVEVKSGYGLATDHELRILGVAAGLAKSRISVVPTFLGAHVPDRGADRLGYVDLVIEEMLPAAVAHATFCDVFCDRGAFTVEDSRRILTAAAGHGLGLRIHAEQLTHSGGAALAAELGAASADHLDHATPEDAAVLATAGVVATLLPAASFSMRSPQAPGRMLWDAGVTIALATDCNPGTSNVESMPLVIALACLKMGFTPEEAVWSATLGGAKSLQLTDRGYLAAGSLADLVVLDAPSYEDIPYRPGTDLVHKVMKAGEWVL